HATHEDRCKKSADIAHHSAAKSEKNRAPVRAAFHQLRRKLFQLRQLLAALAIGHLQDFQLAPGAAETLLQCAPPVLADLWGSEDEDARLCGNNVAQCGCGRA